MKSGLFFLILLSPCLRAQDSPQTQQQTAPQQTQQVRIVTAPSFEVKFVGGWFRPDVTPLTDGFTRVENAIGVRTWGASRVPYFAGVEARVMAFEDNFVVGEAAFGMTGRVQDEDESWMSLWRAGVGYRMQFLPNPLHASVQATVGLAGFAASRSYNQKTLFLNASKVQWYFAGSAAISYHLLSRTAVELSAGYVVTPKFNTVTPEASFKLGAPVIGLGVVLMFM